jgi:hypothetical protein
VVWEELTYVKAGRKLHTHVKACFPINVMELIRTYDVMESFRTNKYIDIDVLAVDDFST